MFEEEMTRPKCHLSEGDVLGRFVDLRKKVYSAYV